MLVEAVPVDEACGTGGQSNHPNAREVANLPSVVVKSASEDFDVVAEPRERKGNLSDVYVLASGVLPAGFRQRSAMDGDQGHPGAGRSFAGAGPRCKDRRGL